MYQFPEEFLKTTQKALGPLTQEQVMAGIAGIVAGSLVSQIIPMAAIIQLAWLAFWALLGISMTFPLKGLALYKHIIITMRYNAAIMFGNLPRVDPVALYGTHQVDMMPYVLTDENGIPYFEFTPTSSEES
jgi:hypothetical protein